MAYEWKRPSLTDLSAHRVPRVLSDVIADYYAPTVGHRVFRVLDQTTWAEIESLAWKATSCAVMFFDRPVHVDHGLSLEQQGAKIWQDLCQESESENQAGVDFKIVPSFLTAFANLCRAEGLETGARDPDTFFEIPENEDQHLGRLAAELLALETRVQQLRSELAQKQAPQNKSQVTSFKEWHAVSLLAR